MGTLNFSRSFSRLAVLGALAAALALGACGRKGPLEAPPSSNSMAAAPQGQQEPAPEVDQSNFEERTVNGMPTPRPNRKTFVLDPLLGNDGSRPDASSSASTPKR